jgi:hypothetical protein
MTRFKIRKRLKGSAKSFGIIAALCVVYILVCVDPSCKLDLNP